MVKCLVQVARLQGEGRCDVEVQNLIFDMKTQ